MKKDLDAFCCGKCFYYNGDMNDNRAFCDEREDFVSKGFYCYRYEEDETKEQKMTIDEIAKDILKKEENQLARAFTMVIGSLLLSKGIQPIINKSIEEWNENDDLNKYIIRKKYNATFDIDTTEHDKQIRADERAKVLDEVEKLYRDWLYSEYGKKADTDNLTIRVISHLKEQSDD